MFKYRLSLIIFFICSFFSYHTYTSEKKDSSKKTISIEKVISKNEESTINMLAFSKYRDTKLALTVCGANITAWWIEDQDIFTSKKITVPHVVRSIAILKIKCGYDKKDEEVNIFLGTNNKVLEIWDLEKPDEVSAIHNLRGYVNSISISPNELFLFSIDNLVKLYPDSKGFSFKKPITAINHNSTVKCSIFSNDEKYIISCDEKGTIYLTDIADFNAIKGPITIGTNPKHTIESLSISKDSKFILAGLENGNVNLYHISNLSTPHYNLISKNNFSVKTVTFNDNIHKNLAIITSGPILKIYDINDILSKILDIKNINPICYQKIDEEQEIQYMAILENFILVILNSTIISCRINLA